MEFVRRVTGRARRAAQQAGVVVRVDCPVAVLELLYVREVWGLRALPDLPPPSAPPPGTGTGPPGAPADAVSLCERWWADYRAVRGRPGSSGAAPLSWVVRYGDEGLDRAALTAYVDAARAQTLASLRASGPRTAAGAALRVRELFGAEPAGEVHVDVLPLAATWTGPAGPTHYACDLASWSSRVPGGGAG